MCVCVCVFVSVHVCVDHVELCYSFMFNILCNTCAYRSHYTNGLVLIFHFHHMYIAGEEFPHFLLSLCRAGPRDERAVSYEGQFKNF